MLKIIAFEMTSGISQTSGGLHAVLQMKQQILSHQQAVKSRAKLSENFESVKKSLNQLKNYSNDKVYVKIRSTHILILRWAIIPPGHQHVITLSLKLFESDIFPAAVQLHGQTGLLLSHISRMGILQMQRGFSACWLGDSTEKEEQAESK